jgi:hypothetical protein
VNEIEPTEENRELKPGAEMTQIPINDDDNSIENSLPKNVI